MGRIACWADFACESCQECKLRVQEVAFGATLGGVLFLGVRRLDAEARKSHLTHEWRKGFSRIFRS